MVGIAKHIASHIANISIFPLCMQANVYPTEKKMYLLLQ